MKFGDDLLMFPYYKYGNMSNSKISYNEGTTLIKSPGKIFSITVQDLKLKFQNLTEEKTMHFHYYPLGKALLKEKYFYRYFAEFSQGFNSTSRELLLVRL